MAKKKPAKKKSAPKATTVNKRMALSARLKEREQQKLLEGAWAKGLTDLSAKERRAIEAHERDIFLAGLSAIPKGLFSEIVDSSVKVLKDIAETRGFPWPRNIRDPVDGFVAMRFLYRYFLKHSQPSRARNEPVSDETLLFDGASKELKDQLVYEQIQDRRLKNMREQVRLQHLTEAHMPTAKVREEFGSLASIIAKRRETLERMITKEPYRTIVSQAFEDMADDANKRGIALMDIETLKDTDGK